MRAPAAFRCCSQAAISLMRRLGSSILRSRHWPRSTPISISTMLSQLACFGGVMELQASQNSPGFGGRECLIEGAGRVGRQVVLYDPDARSIGVMDIDKLAHALGVVFCRPPLGELDLAPGPMHVHADKEIDGAVAAG